MCHVIFVVCLITNGKQFKYTKKLAIQTRKSGIRWRGGPGVKLSTGDCFAEPVPSPVLSLTKRWRRARNDTFILLTKGSILWADDVVIRQAKAKSDALGYSGVAPPCDALLFSTAKKVGKNAAPAAPPDPSAFRPLVNSPGEEEKRLAGLDSTSGLSSGLRVGADG